MVALIKNNLPHYWLPLSHLHLAIVPGLKQDAMMQMVLGALFIVPSLVNCLPKRQTDCAPIHLVVARGSTEPPGLGVLESLVNIIVKANPSATSEAIVYPADLDDYVASVINGTAAVKKQVTAYVERCPRSKIVLIGYSQGAHVIGDGLCGGDGVTYGNYTPGLEKSISSHGAYRCYRRKSSGT